MPAKKDDISCTTPTYNYSRGPTLYFHCWLSSFLLKTSKNTCVLPKEFLPAIMTRHPFKKGNCFTKITNQQKSPGKKGFKSRDTPVISLLNENPMKANSPNIWVFP